MTITLDILKQRRLAEWQAVTAKGEAKAKKVFERRVLPRLYKKPMSYWFTSDVYLRNIAANFGLKTERCGPPGNIQWCIEVPAG